MATSNFGTLCAYDINKENWQSYVEHLKLFFTTNDVNDAEKKRAILLTSCGIETYRLFKGLTAPAKPVEKTFNELVILMTNHENPKRNPILLRDFNSTCVTEKQEKLYHNTWQNYAGAVNIVSMVIH